MYYKYIIFGNSPHKVKSLWLICILETDGPFGFGKGPRGFKHLDAAIWIAYKPEEQTHCPKQFALSKKISAFFLKCNVIRHLISGILLWNELLNLMSSVGICWLHHLNPPLNLWSPLKLPSPQVTPGPPRLDGRSWKPTGRRGFSLSCGLTRVSPIQNVEGLEVKGYMMLQYVTCIIHMGMDQYLLIPSY